MRSLVLFLLLLVGLALPLLWQEAPMKDLPEVVAGPRILPGIQADGRIQLPNQWSLRPVGQQVELGDFPINMVLHPNGQHLAILHQGFGDHEIMILDMESRKKVSRHVIEQTFYGLCISADGKSVYASGGEREVVHQLDFRDGTLTNPKKIRIVPEKEKFIPGGVAVDRDNKTLFVCGTWGHAVAVVPLDKPADLVKVPTGADTHPYTALVAPDGKRVYISLWGAAQVAVLDIEGKKITATWDTEKHPTEMTLSPDGKTLFVACANSTRVSVLNADDGKPLQTLDTALYPGSPSGNTPNSLSLTPDGQLLFVANADANNVAVFKIEKGAGASPMGFIPVGWYPTSVRYDPVGKKILVANGKGAMPKSNRHGPNVLNRMMGLDEYIAKLFIGQLSIIPLPNAEQLAAHTKSAFACSPLRKDFAPTGTRPENNPIPAKVGDPSPIKYCIYIIKENRTYDQVFGDIKEGNGDPSLCIFPEKITPNHHKLVRDFVLLDNFYVESEVSADGHQWSMAAYASDYVEKVWPLTYRGSLGNKFGYPSEGTNPVLETPAGGYIWDRAAEAKVTYRSYGEWVKNGKTADDPATANVPSLVGHIDEKFRGYDLDYPDVKRAERFLSEMRRYEAAGQDMPRLQIVRLPNDHTYGSRVGKPTPTAMVAENDLALGQFVEGVSKSKFWKETAIFVIEDDAQNGPDHVDAHRTVALVISPWTKRKYVDSTMYSTASILRSMELILGMKPMSQFDAAARPMYASFSDRPDLTPYTHLPANVDVNAQNQLGAWGAELSEKFDLAKEDAADDLLFNEVIWRSVRGPTSRMPAPVRAAFVVPKVKKDDDD